MVQNQYQLHPAPRSACLMTQMRCRGSGSDLWVGDPAGFAQGRGINAVAGGFLVLLPPCTFAPSKEQQVTWFYRYVSLFRSRRTTHGCVRT